MPTIVVWPIAVPDVDGMDFDTAIATLQTSAFMQYAIDGAPGMSSATGTIIGQSPAAGTEVDPQTTVVTLTVESDISIVVGTAQALAIVTLLAMGFTYRITQEVHSTIAIGVVLRTTPEGVATVGTEVELIVSKGPGNAPANFVGTAIHAHKVHLTWDA